MKSGEVFGQTEIRPTRTEGKQCWVRKNVSAENIFVCCTTTVEIVFPSFLSYEESVCVLSFRIGPLMKSGGMFGQTEIWTD